jgi:hypothetical protein
MANINYNPIKGRQISFDSIGKIFDRNEYIVENNIPMSEDGSIYNLSTFYMYCRENIVDKTTTAYVL